jgi:hypothetical protein
VTPTRSYALADIGRAGLGNELFPWARAHLWAREAGAEILAPRWRKLRIGPYLRREVDKRQYHRLLGTEHYVRGLARTRILATGRTVDEGGACEGRRCVRVFRGMGDFFVPLTGQHRLLADLLERDATAEVRRATAARRPRTPYIGVHVRRGDFQPASPEALRAGRHNFQTPTAWFEAAVIALRHAFPDRPIVLVSDGTTDELRPLLSLEGVVRPPSGSSLADLLLLSGTSVLVASASSFSAWASYLGHVPTLVHPGQLRLYDAGREFEYAGGALPGPFLDVTGPQAQPGLADEHS